MGVVIMKSVRSASFELKKNGVWVHTKSITDYIDGGDKDEEEEDVQAAPKSANKQGE